MANQNIVYDHCTFIMVVQLKLMLDEFLYLFRSTFISFLCFTYKDEICSLQAYFYFYCSPSKAPSRSDYFCDEIALLLPIK